MKRPDSDIIVPMNSGLPSLLADIEEGVIDLGWGHPSPRLHPVEYLRLASNRMLSRRDPRPLQYGATQGYGPYLESLATFLSSQSAYGMAVDPYELFLTAGASQGLDLACTLYSEPADVVVVEEPTYFVIERIFRAHKLNVVGIPTDSEGMDVDALEDRLKEGLRPKLVYTIPTFQNPTGSSMTTERRRHLVELAVRYDFHILADEVYQLVHFEPLPPAPLIYFDQDGRVISFGSFSKILAPGLRTGWIHGSRAVVSKFSDAAVTFSGGGFNQYASALIREVIEMGFLNEHIKTLRREYAARADVMHAALQTNLGEVVEYAIPTGGYYFWLRFVDGLDTDVFLETARRNGVSYRPGNAFSEAGRFSNHLRLTYTLFEPGDIRVGITRLAAAHRGR